MEIGYINFGHEERSNLYKVIQSIRDHHAIDELGLGRIVSMYPLSSDREHYDRMNAVLSLYCLTMGQPRQEELLSLFKDLTAGQTERLLFNLSPIKRATGGQDVTNVK